jgi:SAM-dependent methyltransferase
MAGLGARVRTRLFRARRNVRDRLLAEPDFKTVREDLAARYLRGEGLELGALNLPLRLPAAAQVRYVDRKASPEADWPEMAGQGFARVEIVDDAQTLATVADGSQDFVVANHVLEHLEDPIAALEAFGRVLRPGGIAFIALPEHERTFDAPREATTIEHLERDHAEGPAGSRPGHYEEWVRLVERFDEAVVAARSRDLDAKDDSIHFHVFSRHSWTGLLLHLRESAGLPFDVELVQANGDEFVTLLRRRPVS